MFLGRSPLVVKDVCSCRATALRYNRVVARAKPVAISCEITRLLHFVRNNNALLL